MAEESIIIIGAGLAGLATGCYARMNGYRTHIFEHHSLPGGVVAAWRRGDYLFDGCIHYVMGRKPNQATCGLYRELGVVPANRFLDMTSYCRFVEEAGRRTLDVTSDLERFAADAAALSPGDAKPIAQILAGARAMRRGDLIGASTARGSPHPARRSCKPSSRRNGTGGTTCTRTGRGTRPRSSASPPTCWTASSGRET